MTAAVLLTSQAVTAALHDASSKLGRAWPTAQGLSSCHQVHFKEMSLPVDGRKVLVCA